jgi:Mg-chelatase subunit ChlD
MGPSIQQARENARQLIRDLRRIAPNLRVAIVQFRDSTDNPEYQVVQPMTASRAQIEAALNSLTAAGGGDAPEAHNLAFNRSYADPGNAIGWRANSRKIVIVISDQQPHGAGSAGIPSCTDTSADPNGLNTATELAGMRAAQRTLIMILQSSSAPAGLLDC